MTDVQSILKERSKTHGNWRDQAACAQAIKANIRGNWDAETTSLSMREALDMIAHKISRICLGDPSHIDHWDDIAGYATLIANELRKGESAK